MTTRPTVDVIIPVFNREQLIRRAIASVLAQTYDRWQLIVVDDGSTDGTIDAVREFSDDRLTLVEGAHSGVSTARNVGAATGIGSHVIFLDSDDEVEPRWLEALLDDGDDAGIVSCGARVVRPGEPAETRLPSRLGPEFHGLTGHFLPGCFLVRRDVFERAGGYAPQLSFGENTELALRLTEATVNMGLTTRVVDDELLIIHQQAGGISQAAKPARLFESSIYLLEHHRERISLNPNHLARCHAIAGVNALRLGRRRIARQHLRSALRIKPGSWRYWLRLAQASLPNLLRR